MPKKPPPSALQGNENPLSDDPNKSAWSKANPLLVQAAYGVLLLFFLAGSILSAYRERLVSFIITVVVVVSLVLAVIGISWIAGKKGIFWDWTGNVLITSALGGIIALFLTILFYVGTGYPAWLDVWFGPTLRVDAPKGNRAFGDTSAQNSGRMVVRRDDGSFELRGQAAKQQVKEQSSESLRLARQRRSPAMQAPVAEYSATIEWDRDVPSDVEMEVVLVRGEVVNPRAGGDDSRDHPSSMSGGGRSILAIFASRNADPNSSSSKLVSGQDGRVTFTGLISGQIYEYKITAMRKNRRSAPVSGCYATPVDYAVVEPQSVWPEYITYYSGQRKCDGNIEDDDGIIIEEYRQYFDVKKGQRLSQGVVPRWVYLGSIKDSRPTWDGKIYADPVECEVGACGSTCEAHARPDGEGEGICDIYFDGISVSNTLYDARSHYRGNVKFHENGSRRLGPFRYDFHGYGILEARDTSYSDVYVGEWEQRSSKNVHLIKNATLADVSIFRTGKLLTGKHVEISDCLMSLSPSGSREMAGAGFRATCGSLEVGSYRGRSEPYNGLQSDFRQGSAVYLLRSGVKSVLSKPSSQDKECFNNENFDVLTSKAWNLKCDLGRTRSCTISNRETDTQFRISWERNEFPQVLFLSPQNRDADGFVEIDNDRYEVAKSNGKDGRLSGLAVLAQMCDAQTFQVKPSQNVVSLDNFCSSVAVAFARLRTCLPLD